MPIYPKDFIYAKVCHNCYRLFSEYCERRETVPTDASLNKFGCQAFFDPIDLSKVATYRGVESIDRSCRGNCKRYKVNYCIKQKETKKNPETETCEFFMVRPYFREHDLGLAIVTGEKKDAERKAQELLREC